MRRKEYIDHLLKQVEFLSIRVSRLEQPPIFKAGDRAMLRSVGTSHEPEVVEREVTVLGYEYVQTRDIHPTYHVCLCNSAGSPPHYIRVGPASFYTLVPLPPNYTGIKPV